MLIFFLFFFAGNTFFEHVHYVDGGKIVHSHPYKKDSKGNPVHSHTSSEYLVIEFINTFVYYFTSVSALISGTLFLREVFLSFHKNPLFIFEGFSSISFRGPPAVIFS